MAAVIKLRKIGNSLGVILPRDEISRLHMAEGDDLTVTRTDNGIQISPYDQSFEIKTKAFEKSRRRYRNALRELAK